MTYPTLPNYQILTEHLIEYSRLKHEYGAQNISELLEEAQQALTSILAKLKALPIDAELAKEEPDILSEIKAKRTAGPRKLWDSFKTETYLDKLEGAFLARLAGCTLGSPVEFWEIIHMKEWADYIGDEFPPVDYWSQARTPADIRYGRNKYIDYTRGAMKEVPVDDDIAYTLLGLLIMEDYGKDFSVEDVGKAWLKYLPYACTAENVALNNLKANLPALTVADENNPYCQWIGADIRSDPWAYMAPANPEKAAEFAYRDAYISHRRNGIYGEMFFSAAQSAAFAVDNPIDAIKIGLTEIPKNCRLYQDIEWALAAGKDIKNYLQAREAVNEHFKGMGRVHTNNNACLTVFGLMIGGTDVTRVISETVAMGMDNDCTAATAGSIVGAIVGKKGVPEHWYRNYNNIVNSYLIGNEKFQIDDLIRRFAAQAELNYK